MRKIFLCSLTVVASMGHAATASLPTEDFEAAQPSNASYPAGPIPGTSIESLLGNAWISPGDGIGTGRYLILGSGWYGSFDSATQLGTTTVQSMASIDLLAGYRYTLSYDYSRDGGWGGNGPFETHLQVSLGGQSVTYDDVSGFNFSHEWHSGSLTITPTQDILGAHITVSAYGPNGYSAMAVDNIAMAGVPAAVVPEPAAAALMLLGGAALVARRRLVVTRQP